LHALNWVKSQHESKTPSQSNILVEDKAADKTTPLSINPLFAIEMNPPLFVPPPLSVAIIDWAFQGVLVFLTIVYPWFMRRGRLGRLFLLLTFTGFVWGAWRMFFFDLITNNDVPGMGYLVAGPFAWFYALVIYGIRVTATKGWKRLRRWRQDNQNPPSGGGTSPNGGEQDAP
jgi:hypothetical protein